MHLFSVNSALKTLYTALDATISGSPVHCSVLVSVTLQQGNCVTVRRPSHGSKHRSSVPIRTGSPHSVDLMSVAFKFRNRAVISQIII